MNGKIDRLKIIEQAERYVRAGRLKEAIAEYEKLLEDDPADVSINNLVGDLYVRLGQNDKAIKAFEKVADEYEKRSLNSQALAILKKICRLNPDKPDYFIKMADLYTRQGFLAEAKQEYLRIAEKFLRQKMVEEAIELYEKVVKLDKDDLNIRIQLAALYKLNGQQDKAVNELLKAADLKISLGQIDEAEKLLKESNKLSPDNARTKLRLAKVLRLKGQAGQAQELARQVLDKIPHDLDALTFLGNLYFEEGKFSAAKEIFTEVLNFYPMNVNARYKIGRINLAEGNPNLAFEYFEPLIDSYLKKRKEDKAIGLLGLILTVRSDHIPAMEKLAEILRETNDFDRLEKVDERLIEEFKKIGEKSKMLPYYAELIKLRPTDEQLAREYRELKKELMIKEEELPPETWALSAEEEEEIQAGLAQADMYIQEGLVRLARRVIEGLLVKYPNDPLLKQKLSYIDNLKPSLNKEDLIRKIEKTTAIETQVIYPKAKEEKDTRKKPEFDLEEQILSEEKISPIDLFTDTGIIPIISSDGREKKFYDLQENIRAELAMLSAVYMHQKTGVTTQFEKELMTIVNDFKKGIREKIPAEDYQIHLQLGLAFMEQGLVDEAIEEFNIAAKDKNLTLECLTLISHSYRLKGNLKEAESWLNRAIKLVAPGTDQYFALMFDLGMIYEQSKEFDKALSIYRDIQSWNPAYQSVSERINRLQGLVGTSNTPVN
ncbi:MAG TPA: tetratricopeptide repeat protein [Candidatus Saccharicenans sp.]|jgi:tetratricopeptide (TPR) repeat protein|nr:tetratricopeptide repeat protein [Candidatus Saccharicenans sp.]HRD01925.1 tetratricopeptide repeat protein [Candidatus Saccharicenans sp.]